MASPPRDNEMEAAPQPHDSPSRAVGGVAALSAPEPAPLSPSGHHDDHLGGGRDPTPQQKQRDIEGIFDDGDDDIETNGALPSVPRRAEGEQAQQANDEEEEDEDEEDEEERRRRRRRRDAVEDEEAEAAQRR